MILASGDSGGSVIVWDVIKAEIKATLGKRQFTQEWSNKDSTDIGDLIREWTGGRPSAGALLASRGPHFTTITSSPIRDHNVGYQEQQ